MKKTDKLGIAAFDFDGTLTTKDTLFQFIIFCVGWPKFILGLVIFSPIFLLYLLRLKSNSEAKEILFKLYFGGMPFTVFQNYCKNFKINISQMLNNEAINKYNWHKNNNHKLIIISASVENWILPWAHEMGFAKVIGTKIEVKDGLLTGKFQSKNCHGAEKVIRLKAEFANLKDYTLYAYGDSNGDTELLKEADFSFFRKFN